MNYKNYIKNNKLILPKGFNSYLNCSINNLSELILPEGFNSDLFCHHNNLTELILPEGFNSYSVCDNPDIYKIANCNINSLKLLLSQYKELLNPSGNINSLKLLP